MHKSCRLCGESKPLTEFYKHAGSNDGLRGECKECAKANRTARYHGEDHKIRRRELRGRNVDNVRRIKRESWFRSKYGIAPAEHTAMLNAQNHKCAICGDPLAPGHVDHDHVTGRVRSILCMSCNTGLGQFKDSPARLLQAAAYLEKHHGYLPDEPRSDDGVGCGQLPPALDR